MKFKIVFVTLLLIIFSCKNDDSDINDMSFSGTIQWNKTFGGSQEDFAQSIIQTSDGNFVILGTSESIDGTITDKTIIDKDYWVIKIDKEGSVIWSKTYGGSGEDIGQKVIETSDGGLAIVGYSQSSDGDASANQGFHDNWLLKLDSHGTILWEKSYGFAGHDHAYSLIQTSDGGYFMTGFLDVTASGGEGNNRNSSTNRHGIGEFWCHKLDATGNIQWRRYFGGTNNDRSYDVVQANDGGYVVTGFSESTDFDISNNHGSYDYWVIKLDSQGNLLWEKSFGGSEIDQSRAIVKTNDNNYVIAGNSFSNDGDIDSNLGSSDFWLIKINDLGELIWSKNYGGPDFDYATSIKKSLNGFVVSGYSQSANNHLSSNYGNNDFWVIKIDEQGFLLWQKNFGGSGFDLAMDAIETFDNHIIVVGETESNDYDIVENRGLKDVLVVNIK
jgi:hypothetical protein